ncbi:hypothetical protein C8J56DRAFT_969997 [Mycena floridula]|nr:hypothetical protein C8J56DRAFT_969997 [Mycena floridula]
MSTKDKEKHYWAQLRGALTAGQWTSPIAAKAPNGSALSWSELFRKFNKHCKGFQDIAEVASQNHALALLLGDENDDEADLYPLQLGDESILLPERVAEASTGYEILKGLESSNFDTLNFALAYYAYALGNPSECLAHLSKVPDVSHVQNHIPLPGTLRANTSTLLVPEGSFDPGTSSTTGSFMTDVSSSIPEIKDGRAWAMTETFRSLCLQGMSHEKLGDPNVALRSYSAAFPLLKLAETEIGTIVSPMPSGKIDFTSYTRFRELWRWVERLLWRAIVLASQTFDIHHDHRDAECPESDSLWTWLTHYSACSAYWPSNFRTAHRSTISVLYLRALVLRYALPPANPTTELVKPPPWLHTARSIIQDYRAILSVCTRFPKAGERNVKVEDFVDLCVAIWEASGAVGAYTGWVLDVLWWATRMTFNSFPILRHMTRLLHVSDDTALSKRTLRLYVQVVGKAWQASNADSGSDADTDQKWVETLIFGIRMLCKSASQLPGLEGIEDVREAGTLVEKARTRLDKADNALSAALDLAEGVWQSVAAIKEQNPHSRITRLTAAHELFLRSVEIFPTASGCYHLALSFARSGPFQDLDQAIAHAGRAVEGDSKEIRYWHLIGLLSAAIEQWDAADMALETGSAIGEPAIGAQDGMPVNGTPKVNGIANGNGRAIDGLPPAEVAAVYLLSKDALILPPAWELLQPAMDHPPASRHEVFEHALQIRMTQITVTEYVEGAEGAAEQLPDVFQWIAEKRGVSGENTRTSSDGGRSGDMRLKSPSEIGLSSSQNGHEKATIDQQPLRLSISRVNTKESPPSINVFPATPDESSPRHRFSMEEQREDLKILEPEPSSSTSKKMQQMWKNQVHKGGARISTISRKIGSGVNGTLRRSNSTPDFHAAMRQAPYQASSIHSRRRISSLRRGPETIPGHSPPPPPAPSLTPNSQTRLNGRTGRENRLLSDLWLMSAATFRRLGKIEQAKAAIQEAEVKDERNPRVWVQLGLYYLALGHTQDAIDALQKALFIDPDDVAASVHLCRLHLSRDNAMEVDLAAGMLGHLTKGPGWDVPEAWYFLAKAYGMQGRKDRERECLTFALGLSERRGVREISAAVGLCL